MPLRHEEPHRNEGFSQANFSHMMHNNGQMQARNPEVNRGESEHMEEDHPRDGIPQPPDIATRTRCYKLNLDSEIYPQSLVY